MMAWICHLRKIALVEGLLDYNKRTGSGLPLYLRIPLIGAENRGVAINGPGVIAGEHTPLRKSVPTQEISQP